MTVTPLYIIRQLAVPLHQLAVAAAGVRCVVGETHRCVVRESHIEASAGECTMRVEVARG